MHLIISMFSLMTSHFETAGNTKQKLEDVHELFQDIVREEQAI